MSRATSAAREREGSTAPALYPQSGYSVSVWAEKMYLCDFRERGDCSIPRAVVWDAKGRGACGAHSQDLARRKP